MVTKMDVKDLNIDQERLREICRRYHVRRMALFGSALRDDFRPESDVDMLVEFEPGHTPGLGFILSLAKIRSLTISTI